MDLIVIDDSTNGDDGEELPQRPSSPANSSPLTTLVAPVREAERDSGFPRERGRTGSPGRQRRGSPSPSRPSQSPAPAVLQRYPRFFTVFFPELCSDHLDISHAFRLNLSDALGGGGACTLEGPSGNAWRVDLEWPEGGLPRFEGGWTGFVRDHGLRAGEFLVFEYRGGSRFSVLVLDESACEKPGAFLASPREGSDGTPTARAGKGKGDQVGEPDQQRGAPEGSQLRRSNRPRRARDLWADCFPGSSAMRDERKRRRTEKTRVGTKSRKKATAAAKDAAVKTGIHAGIMTSTGIGQDESAPQLRPVIKRRCKGRVDGWRRSDRRSLSWTGCLLNPNATSNTTCAFQSTSPGRSSYPASPPVASSSGPSAGRPTAPSATCAAAAPSSAAGGASYA